MRSILFIGLTSFSLLAGCTVKQPADNSITPSNLRAAVLDGYKKTTITDDKIRDYKGVSPLDESQWILHMRGAFKADER